MGLRLALALLAASAVTSSAPARAQAPSAPAFAPEGISARVIARAGRVQLVDERGELAVVSRELERRAGERAHVEVGAGSVAEIVWTDLASARVEGPCTLEWRRADDVLTLPGEAARVACRLTALGSLELEVRRGAFALEAPGGWRIALGRAAVGLRAHSGGACRVELRAGDELAIEGPRDVRVLWPRRTLTAGEALVLDARAAPPSRPDLARHAPRWTRDDWPWISSAPARIVATSTPERTVATPTPDRSEAPLPPLAPAPAGDVRLDELPPSAETSRAPLDAPMRSAPLAPASTADDPERWPPTPSERVASSPIDAAGDAAGGSAGARRDPLSPANAIEPAGAVSVGGSSAPEDAPATAPAPAAEVEPADAPRASESSLPFHALDWRGLPWEELDARGAWVFSRREGLLLTEHPDGRISATLPIGARRSAWCLGPRHDVELRPGATVALSRDGTLGAHFGAVRVLDALPSRPPFSAIQPPRRP